MSARRAIVMSADRDWALAQKPEEIRMHDEESDDDFEIVDDGGWMDADKPLKHQGPSWFSFVVGEVEAFEAYFGDDLKTHAEWSTLWRNSWWPKRREDWVWKHMTNERYPKRIKDFERWYAARLAQIKTTTTERGIDEALEAIRPYAENKLCHPRRLVEAERLAKVARAKLKRNAA